MRFFTVHTTRSRPDAPPVLVPEGFSWGALVFGPLWLAARAAWVPAGLALAAVLLIARFSDGATEIILAITLGVLLGLTGHDLHRWSLALRGYVMVHVVGARNEDGALARLFAARPDLADPLVPADLPR